MFCLYGVLSQNCLEILENKRGGSEFSDILENKRGEYQNSVEGEDFLVEV